MTRNLKALGFALVAIFAVSALSAQAAMAVEHSWTITNGGKFFTGKIIDHPGLPDTDFHLAIFGEKAKLECPGSSLSGTITGEKQDKLVATPIYSECKMGGTGVTVTNGEGPGKKHCTTTIYTDTTPDPYTGGESSVVELSCEEGQSIKVSAPGCTITIGNQAALHGVDLENEGNEPTGVEATIHTGKLKYVATGASCALLGIKTGEQGDGTTIVNWTMTAYKDSKHLEQVGMHVTTP